MQAWQTRWRGGDLATALRLCLCKNRDGRFPLEARAHGGPGPGHESAAIQKSLSACGTGKVNSQNGMDTHPAYSPSQVRRRPAVGDSAEILLVARSVRVNRRFFSGRPTRTRWFFSRRGGARRQGAGQLHAMYAMYIPGWSFWCETVRAMALHLPVWLPAAHMECAC